MAVSKPSLFTIEHPLLDMIAEVDDSFLQEYGLEPNGATLYSREKHRDIFEKLQTFKSVKLVPGGATQNSARITQWILSHSLEETKGGNIIFAGGVGRDKYAEILKEASEQNGVQVEYVYLEVPTGICGVLVTGKKNRSLVAHLSAANEYKLEHIERDSVWEAVVSCQFYYISGFFLSTSFETIMKIAHHAEEYNKQFTFNLGAGFICINHPQELLTVLSYSDVVFCNESEAVTFAETNGLEIKDPQQIACHISSIPFCPKKRHTKKRITVITQGENPTIMVDSQGNLSLIPVISIPKSEIVDTNGAGDAFVGGFLSQFIQGKDLGACINAAHYCAHEILRVSGCTLDHPPCQTNF